MSDWTGHSTGVGELNLKADEYLKSDASLLQFKARKLYESFIPPNNRKMFLHFQRGVKMGIVLSKVNKWGVNFSSCQD